MAAAAVTGMLATTMGLPLLVAAPRLTQPAVAGGAVADIPAVLLGVYADAAARCPGLRWQLLAAVAKIESDHGRYGSATLTADLDVTPPIVGPALDGSPGVAAIAVPAGGSPWHDDPRWDRATGPMQFITATWAAWGVDADGDGTASPHTYPDAAVGAADYLCHAAGGRIDDENDERRALWAYNRSSVYADDVLAWAARYTLTGGGPVEVAVLLAHPNVTMSAAARADLEAGTVDWRLVALLAELAGRWRLHLINFATGHSRCAVLPGGANTGPGCSVSNHYYGRATDIALVGPADSPAVPVTATNPHARALADYLAGRPADLLSPDEVGQPWADLARRPGWFTNSLHRHHFHVAFETPPPPPPAPPADPGDVAGASAVPGRVLGDADTPTAEARLAGRADVIWMGTYDHPGPRWWADYGISATFGPDDGTGPDGRRLRAVPAPPGGHGQALRVDFNPHSQPAHTDSAKFGARYHQTLTALGHPRAWEDELYLRYRLYVPGDFGCDTVGGKLPGLAGNPRAGTAPGSGSGGGTYHQSAWSGRLMWRSGCALVGYFYVWAAGSEHISDGPRPDGRYVGIDPYFRRPNGAPLRLTKGAWNTIEVRYRINTPGRHDGRITGWVNGTEGLDLTVTFYGPTHQTFGWGINEIRMDTFYGGPAGVDRPTHLYLDDIVLARAPIGPRSDP